MLDHRTIHNLMQQIDDEWIEKAIYAEKKRTYFQKLVTTAAIIIICILISTGVVAAISVISPTFKQWLMEQFQGPKPEISKISIPEGINEVENGFLIKYMDEENVQVYCLEKEELVHCETNTFESRISFKDMWYDFSFQYVKRGKDIYAWNYQGAAISATGYDENMGIIWLSIDNVWNSYYVDYSKESIVCPVVDTNRYEDLWKKRYYWEDNGENVEGYVKLATDVHVSPDGTYLLYRSNRDCLTTEKGEYNIDTKGDWYVQNVLTGKEEFLENAPSYLHSSEIGFIDDHLICISANETYHNNCPAVYNCELKQEENLVLLSANTDTFCMQYEVIETEKEYQFWNTYLSEMYSISKNADAGMSAFYITSNLICVIESTGNMKFYFIKEKMEMNLGTQTFEDWNEIKDIYDLDQKRFVIVGYEDEELVGYLLDFTKVVEDEK